MIIVSIIVVIIGIVSIVFGYVQNNSMEAQLKSLFGSGSMNPGTIWIIIGIILAVIGVGLFIYMYLYKNNNEK